MRKILKAPKVDEIKSAASAESLWAGVSNDEFFAIQVYYGKLYGKPLRQYDKTTETGVRLRNLGEALQYALAWLNENVDWAEADRRRNERTPISSQPVVQERLTKLQAETRAEAKLWRQILLGVDAAVVCEREEVDAVVSLTRP